jgi:hypothetical protein
MEPIVAPAVIAGITLLSEPLIKDAYERLKAALMSKFGQSTDLIEAVEKLEEKPDSAGRREMLREEMVAARVELDEDVMRAADALLEKLKSLPEGRQVVQQAVTGDGNVFSGTGDVTVNNNG